MRLKIAIPCACFAVMFTACSKEPVITASLELPAARAMVPAKELPAIKKDDDLEVTNGQCRASYGRETSKLTTLQTYVRTILKK